MIAQHPGLIAMPDIMAAFDWGDFDVQWPPPNYPPMEGLHFGTRDFKSIFTTAARFMGYERLLVERPDLTPISEMYCAWNERLLGEWAGKIEWFFVGDDYAWNQGLLISPTWWREWVKPHLARLLEVGRANGCKLIFHSDGDISEIMDDIAELGVSVVNIQLHGRMQRYRRLGEYKGMKLWENMIPQEREQPLT